MTQRTQSRGNRRQAAQEKDLPHMLKSNHVMDYFGLTSPPSLMNLRKQMHFIDLPRFSYSYPFPYTHMLREAIRDRPDQARAKPARRFAGSLVAHHLIQAEELFFDQRLVAATNSDGLVHATDITNLLNIGNSTIVDWEKRGDVEIVRRKHLVYVPADVLREIAPWHRPEAYDPQQFALPSTDQA